MFSIYISIYNILRSEYSHFHHNHYSAHSYHSNTISGMMKSKLLFTHKTKYLKSNIDELNRIIVNITKLVPGGNKFRLTIL